MFRYLSQYKTFTFTWVIFLYNQNSDLGIDIIKPRLTADSNDSYLPSYPQFTIFSLDIFKATLVIPEEINHFLG